MKIAFAGLRHSHIFGLYDMVLNNKRVELAGCFEGNEKARMAAEKSHNIKFNYHTYEDVLNDDSVNIVAIGDYYGIRGRMVIEALKNGKHVICDKPICTSLEELLEIKKLSEGKNLQVCCMFDLRYIPQIKYVKEIIEEGKLGKINNISFTAQHCLDYGNRPEWYFEEGKHGGTINDIAIHGVDLLRLLTGKEFIKVNYAKTWNAFADKEPDFKDCGQFVAEMEDGISVMADVSYAAPKFDGTMPTYWDFYIWGSKAMLNFRYMDNKIKVYSDKEEIIDCGQSEIGFLDALIDEINGISTMMNTKGILETQRQVLEIQKYANETDNYKWI